MKLQDMLVLPSIEQQPDIAIARAAAQDAQTQLTKSETRVTKATQALRDAEHAMAIGGRDERKLAAAQDELVRAESDVRIANARVTHTQDALTQTTHRVCLDIEQTLTEAHRAALPSLVEAMTAARERSHAVMSIALASTRLLPSGPYRKLEPRSLERIFGGPKGLASETVFGWWLSEVQRYLKASA